MKKALVIFVSILFSPSLFGQTIVASQDCNTSENVCSDAGVDFVLAGGGSGLVDDLPAGSNISNPDFGMGPNNGNPNSSGCLNSNENNPNWFVINVATAGVLEFVISGTPGYYDWALWPYYENANGTSACNDITNNILPPVACNWNMTSDGLTGMTTPGFLPAGGDQGNFEYALNVNPGDQFVLCFSNFSGVSGSAVLQFGNDIAGNNNPNSASVTCTPDTPNQTICLGDAATVDIITPNVVSPSFNWLVTTNVSDPNSGTGVLVNPSQTTTYIVEITENAPSGQGNVFYDTFDIIVISPPTPNAGVNQQVCLGTPFVLSGTPSDPNNTHNWTYSAAGVNPTPVVNFSPNTTNNTPSVTANQIGNYYFIYNENNGVCPTASDTVLVSITTLNLTATAVSPSCVGDMDGEIHVTCPDAVQYSFDGGQTWVADSFFMTAQNGSYSVCGISASGCQKCITINVVDPSPVTISVSSDTLICQNGTGYLSAQGAGGNTFNYHWSQTSNLSGSQQVNPFMNTVYSVYAENENGCQSLPSNINVTIREPLSGIISTGDTVCPSYSSDLFTTVSGGLGNPYTFNWSNGITQTGAATQTITVTPSTTQNYTVTVTDECESTPLVLTTFVRVAPAPNPTYSVLNPQQCEPAIFEIVNTTGSNMSVYSYWLIDGEQEFINQDTIITALLWGGNYDIQLIATTNEGCVDSIYIIDGLHVQFAPEANFSFSPNPPTMFNTDVFMQNQSINSTQYDWYFSGGTPQISTQEDVLVRFPDGVTGDYEVTLIVASSLGCYDTITKIISVLPEVIIYAPNSFTPDGDAFNQSWKVIMEGIDPYDFELLIMNRWGEIVWESHDINVGWDGRYNSEPVPSGTYIWTLQTKNAIDDGKVSFSGHLNVFR